MKNDISPISILFACDPNYLQHAAACVASLAEHNPRERFDILVVGTHDFAPIADKFCGSFKDNERLSIRLLKFDVPSSQDFPLPYHLTLETYIRLWIGDFFPNTRRALYLDADTVTTASIVELWNTDLQGRAVAAVPIPGSVRPARHGLPAGTLYFNAGVMLFDLDAWRSRRYRDVCLEYLRKHPEKAIDGDQDILNLCLIDDWLPLPFEWNVISPFYFLSHDMKLSMAEIEKVRDQARIIHFNGSSKPWSYTSPHPRSGEYWKNLRRTAWRDTRPADYTLINVARKLLSRTLPLPVKQALKAMAR